MIQLAGGLPRRQYEPLSDTCCYFAWHGSCVAVLAGFIFLDEIMLPVQLVGCGLILLAVIITQFSAEKSRKPLELVDG